MPHKSRLLSGLKRLYPRIRREVAISQQWYNNWTRQRTPVRAVPITWELVQGFVGVSIHLKWYRLALIFLVGFVFFLRTQEVLSLSAEDLAVDTGEGSIILRLAKSKTSPGAQQSLAMHDLTLAWLVKALLVKIRTQGPLWTSTTHFRTTLQAFCVFFELEAHGFVPYSLRRGGATHLYVKTNNLDLVMITGRWKDAATARVYLDDARATLVRFQLGRSSRMLLRCFRQSLFSFISRVASWQIGGVVVLSFSNLADWGGGATFAIIFDVLAGRVIVGRPFW